MATSSTEISSGGLEYIDVTEFTNNVQTTVDEEGNPLVTGDGILDKLMETATAHLNAQFSANRIRGEDYATAYVQIYQATLQTALQAWMQRKLYETQTETEEAKAALYRRQITAFDQDYRQKILKICMDAWAVGFSVAKDSFEASGIPAPMQKVTIDDLYNQFIVTELDTDDNPNTSPVT